MVGTLAAAVVVIGLIIAALISILGSRVSGGMKVVWIIFIICAPLIGALLWFLIGRRQVSFTS
nr:PLD nuclease N-terminal domain-containing protein [Nocardiopsis ansamitocini]